MESRALSVPHSSFRIHPCYGLTFGVGVGVGVVRSDGNTRDASGDSGEVCLWTIFQDVPMRR